jgi:hypothetical protein
MRYVKRPIMSSRRYVKPWSTHALCHVRHYVKSWCIAWELDIRAYGMRSRVMSNHDTPQHRGGMSNSVMYHEVMSYVAGIQHET